MEHKIREAFDSIHAEENLKETTRTFLLEQTNEYGEKASRNFAYRRAVPVLLSLFLLVIGFGGHRIYFTPTSVISIDMNPSLELGINRFDRVISVEGFQEEGKALAASLSIRHMEYIEALEEIMANERVIEGLSEDEILTISVIGNGGEQNQKMLATIEASTAGHKNTYCYYADTEDVKEAHHTGISYGKYRAFLEVQALDPDITTEDIQEMTMREIHDLTDDHSSGCHDDIQDVESSEQEGQTSGAEDEAGSGHGGGPGDEAEGGHGSGGGDGTGGGHGDGGGHGSGH